MCQRVSFSIDAYRQRTDQALLVQPTASGSRTGQHCQLTAHLAEGRLSTLYR